MTGNVLVKLGIVEACGAVSVKLATTFQMIFTIVLYRKMFLSFGKHGTASLSGINGRMLLLLVLLK